MSRWGELIPHTEDPSCLCGCMDDDASESDQPVDREALEEIIATKVMRYASAADVRSVDDGDPEALDAGVAAVLALLSPEEGRS